MVRSKRLTGLNPFAYMGVDPITPPDLVTLPRSPTPDDSVGFNLGTLWLVEQDAPTPIIPELWILVRIVGVIAEWIQLFPFGAAGATTFPTDAGVAVEVGGILNIFGDTRVTTSGAGNTVTIHLSGTVPIIYDADVGSATPAGGILNIFGSANIATSGAGNTITVGLGGSIASQYVTDAGVAVPIAGIIEIIGGSNINTTGAANVVTINLNNSVVISGTLTVSSLGAGVVQSTAGGLLFSTKGTDGQTLISATAGVPAWANLTSAGGTVFITNGPNTINLEVTPPVPPATDAFLAYFVPTPFPPNSQAFLKPVTVFFNNVVYDPMASYNTVTGRFTAPATGLYRLSYQVVAFDTKTTNPPIWSFIQVLRTGPPNIALNGTSFRLNDNWGFYPGAAVTKGISMHGDGIVQLTAGDVAFVQILDSQPLTPFLFIVGGPGANERYTWFCGERIA